MSEKHLQSKIEELQEQVQSANDMLQAVSNQRNASLNECVQLAAHLQAASRKITSLQGELDKLQPKEVETSVSNDVPA